MTATRNEHREAARADRRPAADVAALDRQLEEIRERNVERAARRLAAAGELTERRREALEALGDALVRRILGPPLENMAAADDRETVRVGRDVFGAD